MKSNFIKKYKLGKKSTDAYAKGFTCVFFFFLKSGYKNNCENGL